MPVELLLIEDNIGDAKLIEHITAQRSDAIRITRANDCSGALARLSAIKPNLVIADMGALEFGGVELMKRCSPHSIPVIVFSGSVDPKDRENMLRLGAKEFVAKPLGLDEYNEAVWRMISKWGEPPSIFKQRRSDVMGTAALKTRATYRRMIQHVEYRMHTHNRKNRPPWWIWFVLVFPIPAFLLAPWYIGMFFVVLAAFMYLAWTD
jgi:DNA-binding NtrC family response regulator